MARTEYQKWLDRKSMSLSAPVHPAEQLLNYIVHHTDLYMRSKRGETAAEMDERWRRALHQLAPFLDGMRERDVKEIARLRKELAELREILDGVERGGGS